MTQHAPKKKTEKQKSATYTRIGGGGANLQSHASQNAVLIGRHIKVFSEHSEPKQNIKRRAVMTRALVLVVVVVVAAVLLEPCGGSQCVGGPCGPSHQQCGPLFEAAPQFHVMDKSCGENDPNGPFYDPVHGLYHLFYQDHLAIDPGKGPDWGHAVSHDFVHWAHLPVAIWNDKPYDRNAIYTGSATIVDGKPVIVYPGLCFSNEYPNCNTGTLLAVAVPEDPSDPLYTNWTKPGYNPIFNNTQRDPSSAWQTSFKEWRFTTFDGLVYGSEDFQTWYKVGLSQFPKGECPSFFPLPKDYRPANTLNSNNNNNLNNNNNNLNNNNNNSNNLNNNLNSRPTHVHKSSHGGKDWMQVGTYTEGQPGTVGNWSATPGFSFDQVLIDAGNFYASKDFYDPVKDRRINWGWAIVPPASTQTLPRHITWHPDLKQLMHSPVEEQKQLRGDALANLSSPQQIKPASQLYLGDWADARGNQSETLAVFHIPDASGTFGVDVMTADNPAAARTRIYVSIEVDKTSQQRTAVVGITDGATPTNMLTPYMNHTDLPGGDFNVTNVNYTDPTVCQAVCLANPDCQAWTYVVRGPLHAACCQKGASGWSYNPHNPTCTSGVRHPEPAPASGYEAPLALLPSDTTIELRVFTDNTFVEAFWMDGRVAMTAKLMGQDPKAGVSLFADNTTVTVDSAAVWHVNSIWVSPSDVLAGMRRP